jgi:hypothetical protein
LDIGKKSRKLRFYVPSKVYTNMKKKIEWALVFALIVSGIGFVCLYASIAIWLGAEVHI